MVELVPIPAQSLAALLPCVLPLLERLAEDSQGRFKAGDYVTGALRGDMQLWSAFDGEEVIGILLTEIIEYPHRREANLWAATGHNADRWIGLMPQVEQWAKAQGCFLLKATCRPGWQPLLQPIGFHKSHVILEKELS